MSDYTVVYFNAIKRGFSIPSTLVEFSIGNLEFSIKWYGVLIATGYLLALIFCTNLAKRAKINVDALYDAIIWGTVGGVLGARAYYVLFNLNYYLANPSHIIKVSEGGLAIYGGVIGAVLAAIIVCKVRKIRPLDILDLAAVGFLIGQGLGRWGNFTNQEAFGCNTNLPWGMMSDKTTEYLIDHQDFMVSHGLTVEPYTGVHPTFLYESIWCLLGFVLLYFMFKNFRKFRGQIALSYGVWYGFERSIVEGLRTDSLYIPNTNLRVSQLLSIALCVICLVLLIVKFLKYKKNPVEIIPDIEEEENNEQETEEA
ncbi:MAG: prolipoprotein diacylglyceryl transferase [Oscillospiraceae bacterium]|nr:prolipoprotein diacylglyceryl transferase [Candidatus Limimonas coprohippi]